MRDRLEILTCDATDCDASVSGPASRLTRRARDAGWQVGAVTALYISDDGPELTRRDRCPAHPVDAFSRDEVLREAGGLGGIQPHDLD